MKISPPACRYWRDCGRADGGCCAIAKYSAKPSYGTCARCNKRMRGFGDLLAWALNRLHLARPAKRLIARVTGKPCRCEARQAGANAILPFKPS